MMALHCQYFSTLSINYNVNTRTHLHTLYVYVCVVYTYSHCNCSVVVIYIYIIDTHIHIIWLHVDMCIHIWHQFLIKGNLRVPLQRTLASSLCPQSAV